MSPPQTLNSEMNNQLQSENSITLSPILLCEMSYTFPHKH